MSGQGTSTEQARSSVFSDPAVRVALRRLALADLVLLVLSALTLWFFPAAFVIAIPILVVILLVAFVAAVVAAVCTCPSTSWICRLAEAGSVMYGYYAQPPDV